MLKTTDRAAWVILAFILGIALGGTIVWTQVSVATFPAEVHPQLDVSQSNRPHALWQQFELMEGKPSTTGDIFTFANYLAALALLSVVLTTVDFRYRYRLMLRRTNQQRAIFWFGLVVGVALLAIDFWYQNGFPIPRLFANPNNLKAVVGLAFLGFVFRVISTAVIYPPAFDKAHAKKFLDVNWHFIHEGSVDRLQVIAEELRRSVEEIIALAAAARKFSGKRNGEKAVPAEQAIATNLLLLIADKRFCKVVVEKVPAFAITCFQEAQKYPHIRVPIFQFARNIGQEFIRNTGSSFYQEDSGFESGLVGYMQPVTRNIFGSYEFVERCAGSGESPLDTDFRELIKFDATQMEGYCRAALAFTESYLKATKGDRYQHSYALFRTLESFRSSLVGVSQLNGTESYDETPAYGRLRTTVHFIRKTMKLVDDHAHKPDNFRISRTHPDIYDSMAQLIFDTIFAAARVSSPVSTAWWIQHNTVWGDIFDFDKSAAGRIVAQKVRRLLYDEIKRMDEFANFKGARVLGYCLNVLGLKPINRHKDYNKRFFSLHAAALNWTKANYRRLVADHPDVAEVCLQGSVSYEADRHRLVKTYANDTPRRPAREYLDLD